MRTIRSLVVAALLTAAVVPAPAAWARRVRIDCHDGAPVVPSGLIACDADRKADGACTFDSTCPPCVFRGCRVACRRDPVFVVATVPVGEQRALSYPRIHTNYVLRCLPPLHE